MNEARRIKIRQQALMKTIRRLGEDGEWKEAVRRFDEARQVKNRPNFIVTLLIVSFTS